MNLFIIGNGKSRLNFDVNSLKSHGKIIGCNYAFRDFHCDAISAVDPKPKDAILKETINLDTIFVDANDPERRIIWDCWDIGQMPNHLIDCDEKHWENWDSGRLALIAGIIKYEPNNVYLLGFDFLDPHNPKLHWQKQESNNIYHNRHIERPPNTERIYNWCVEKYPNINFFRVGPLGDSILDKLTMDCITYDEFKDKHL